MDNINNLSIIIHGQMRDESIDSINSVLKYFPRAEIILVINKSDILKLNFKIEDRIKIIIHDDADIFKDYGYFSRNFLKHTSSALKGIQNAKNTFSLKIRNDIIINNINFPKIKESIDISFFHHTRKVEPIYVYPKYFNKDYFYGDMIVYGHTCNLKLLFDVESCDSYINLWNTTIVPPKLPSKKISFLTPEELLYMSYIYKLFYKNIKPDDIISNKELIPLKIIIRNLDVNCILPHRISKYFKSFNSVVFQYLMRNKLYNILYNVLR